jgi:indole-3-pyruvate monooxygenase
MYKERSERLRTPDPSPRSIVMSHPTRPVLVIGAGPAGLATSACLRREGVPHDVIDRAHTVAPAWHGHYARLHLHTVKRHSTLPLTPWGRDVATYPSRAQVVDYFDGYAREHEVHPSFGVEVQRVTRRADDLLVRTSAGERSVQAVVMATGWNRLPFVPALPGADAFGGLVVHSSAYRDPAPFAGKRTLVVGCGNSGAEIALDLAEHGVDVSMVVRGPVHVVSRDCRSRCAMRWCRRRCGLPWATCRSGASCARRWA